MALPPPTQWDQAALVAVLNNMVPSSHARWVMDYGTTSHMSSNNGIVPSLIPLPSPVFVTVGNGTQVPVRFYNNIHLCLPSSSFVLNSVLRVPSLIKNIISVHQFTRDNVISIEFDPFDFSVKDLRTRHVIIRCNSSGDLYTIPPTPADSSHQAHITYLASATVWHARLGHPGPTVLNKLHSSSTIACNKLSHDICHACQLGKHVRLLFTLSTLSSMHPFELIHYDVWTSPIISNSCFSYYLVLFDDYTHFCWTFPLKQKSDVGVTLVTFHAYVHMQLGIPIKTLQVDNGTKFVNHNLSTFLSNNDIITLVYLVLTPLYKTGRRNACFTPLTTLFTHSYSCIHAT
jgi:hypothetical protein